MLSCLRSSLALPLVAARQLDGLLVVHLHFTLSLTSGGGITGKVYDAHAFLEKMIKSEAAAAKAAAKAVAAPAEAPAAPATPTPKASKKGAPLA